MKHSEFAIYHDYVLQLSELLGLRSTPAGFLFMPLDKAYGMYFHSSCTVALSSHQPGYAEGCIRALGTLAHELWHHHQFDLGDMDVPVPAWVAADPLSQQKAADRCHRLGYTIGTAIHKQEFNAHWVGFAYERVASATDTHLAQMRTIIEMRSNGATRAEVMQHFEMAFVY